MSSTPRIVAFCLLVHISQAYAAVSGCESVADDYNPYGQWQDLPVTRDGLQDYVPITNWPEYADPSVVNETTEATDITIIMMHGKNGTPWFSNMITLADELAAQGYKIVKPTMPWGRNLYYTLNDDRTAWVRHTYFAWDAALCQAMNFIQRLVAQERALGRRVILMGHSMGGHHALLYGYLNTEDDIIGIVTSAPGGLVPLATRPLTETAASRQKAKDLILAGDGDAIDTFDTLNTNGLEQIITTANIYLTYHEPDTDAVPDTVHMPDISHVLPNINEPVLWLVGEDDSLKDFYENKGLFGMLPADSRSSYQVLSGDHLSVLLNESGPINEWFTSWSSINPADRDSDGSADATDAFPDNSAASKDTDGDGLPDSWNPGCDSACQQSSGLIVDNDDDNDGMTDPYEESNGLDPLVDDASLDKDGDGHSNLSEFNAGTAANDPDDFPNQAGVILNMLPLILE